MKNNQGTSVPVYVPKDSNMEHFYNEEKDEHQTRSLSNHFTSLLESRRRLIEGDGNQIDLVRLLGDMPTEVITLLTRILSGKEQSPSLEVQKKVSPQQESERNGLISQACEMQRRIIISTLRVSLL